MRPLLLAGLVVSIAGIGAVAGNADDGSPEAGIVRERDAAGEPCAVCGVPLGPDDKAVQVRGRWVPLHTRECRREFEADPAAVFASMQPRGALFDESFHTPSRLRWGWFLAGGYVLLGLLCGGLASHMAYPRGASPLFWFAAGLAANVAALAWLAMSARPTRPVPVGLRKMHATAEPRPCPSCGASNHPAAGRCLSCGAALAPEQDSEALRAVNP